MLKMSDEFNELQDKKMLVKTTFPDKERKRLEKLMRDPESLFEEEKRNCIYLKKIESLQERINALEKSKSYRIGKAMTYLPRKAKRLLRKK